MIYSALCLENTNYFTTGKILVRIFEYYIHPSKTPEGKLIEQWDLSKNPDLRTAGEEEDSESGEIIQKDFEAYVFAPLGGGKNYGMLSLPKINERGIVSFLDGDFNKPLWLGSYFTPIYDKDRKFQGVNIPTDKVDGDEIFNGADKDGSKMTGDERTIVLRTKHTVSDDADSMDWEQRNTENLIVIDKNKINIVHFLEWENNVAKKYQKIQIENGEVKVEVNNQTDGKISSYSMTEDAMTIEIDDGGTKSTLTISNEDNGISATLDGEKKIKLLGEDNFLTKFNELSEILTYVAEHKHVCPINGLTVEDPVSNDGKPFSAAIASTKNAMKTERIVTE